MLAEIERAIEVAEAALDEVVDATDWWIDLPLAYTDPDDGWGDRFEMRCSFCKSIFWPINLGPEVVNGQYEWDTQPFYYQAGYWFGDPGNGRHFPICSDACHDALQRILEKRRWHTAAEMQRIGKARRLIRECRVVARRLRNAKGIEGRPAIVPGGREGDKVLGQPDRIP